MKIGKGKASGPFRGILRPFFLFGAGGILMDDSVFFLAEDGLKGAAASRPVQGILLRPASISTIEITEFHCSRLFCKQGLVKTVRNEVIQEDPSGQNHKDPQATPNAGFFLVLFPCFIVYSAGTPFFLDRDGL
jgi:hypothetical protein